MGGHKYWVGCAVLSASLWASTASAEPETHDGFFLRLGLNAGPLIASQKLELGGVEGDSQDISGLTTGFDLLLGGTPVDGLVIGGALIGASTSNPKIGDVEPDGTILLAGVGAFGNYYFDPTSGGHLQALLGFAVVDYVSDSGRSGGNDPTGLMFGIGGGYDFWLGGEWSIGPFARVLYAPVSTEEGNSSLKISYLYPSIGVAFTYH